MNWIDSHTRVDEGITVERCGIDRLLFAGDSVPLAYSDHDLQHAFDRFAAA